MNQDLNNILRHCSDHQIEIISFSIGSTKIFPFDDAKLTLIHHMVDGYYRLADNDKVVLLISIKEETGYQVQYDSKGKIRSLIIEKDNYKIIFKQS